ncbi:seminal metalloprotease 1-like [Haematobia irritans]|uniref:seminal metalloprotease 1-like n=1 Tax=Haematobia irritans TaxID=7368 RepID=UPI003F501836
MFLHLRFIWKLTFVFVLLDLITAGPLPITEIDPEEVAGQFEGDILLGENLLAILKGDTNIESRNGLVAEVQRWPNRIVYYRLIGDFDLTHRKAILAGIATLEARTCVRFHEADDNRTDYLAITSEEGGCYTSVGYLGRVQQMNLQIYPLGEGCFRTGTILHEFMHALGFFHQQSDTNRDDYIRVIEENIIPGKEFNFDKYPSSFVTDFDVGYDYESCLHYRPGAFSVNGKDTIVPLDEKAEIGQRVTLSEKDAQKINIMYKCPIEI